MTFTFQQLPAQRRLINHAEFSTQAKVINELDRLTFHFIRILEKYAGYVVIKEIDKGKFSLLYDDLKNGYWCLNAENADEVKMAAGSIKTKPLKPGKDNKKERLNFVDYWAEYVRTHPDKDWSRQQAVLINSQIQNARQMKALTREEYLKIKGEQRKGKN